MYNICIVANSRQHNSLLWVCPISLHSIWVDEDWLYVHSKHVVQQIHNSKCCIGFCWPRGMAGWRCRTQSESSESQSIVLMSLLAWNSGPQSSVSKLLQS